MSGEVEANLAADRAADLVTEAAAERRRVRLGRRAEAERSTFRDALVDVAERDLTVSLALRSGRTHRVRVTSVGADVVVAAFEATVLVVGLDAVVGVIAHGDRGTVRGNRAGQYSRAGENGAGQNSEWRMGDIMAGYVDERPRITVSLGSDHLSGTLVAVGRGVAQVSTDGLGEIAYVRLDSTTEISLSDSSSV